MILIVQQEKDAGRELRLERGLLTIGRGAECDLVLQDRQASQYHAELRRYGDQWLIVDLGSTNGTFVGDVRLQPHEAHPLPPDTPVTIGNTHFILRKEPTDALRSPPLGSQEVWAEPGVSAVAVPTSPVWGVAVWLSRGLVAVGCGLLAWGSLSDWLRVQVRLPLLGTVLDRTFSGMDSGQAWLFIGAAAIALALLLLDVASRRWGLAAGVGQALLGALLAVTATLSIYRYYRVRAQRILGISLLDILIRYARDTVHLSVERGVYLVAAGVVALVLGGLLRLILAELESVET